MLGMIAATVVEGLRQKYQLLKSELDERGRRLWAASESLVLGHGGVKAVVEATGLAENTVRRGRRELRAPTGARPAPVRRIRCPGGGRPLESFLSVRDCTIVGLILAERDCITSADPRCVGHAACPPNKVFRNWPIMPPPRSSHRRRRNHNAPLTASPGHGSPQ